MEQYKEVQSGQSGIARTHTWTYISLRTPVLLYCNIIVMLVLKMSLCGKYYN